MRMKNSIPFSLVAILVLVVSSCSNNQSGNEVDGDMVSNNKTADNPNAQNPEPSIKFDEEIWEFGDINEGEIVRHSFHFTNTGNEDLVISRCQASCGCTTPKCEKKPVAPGERGVIEIKFDSSGKQGNQTKNITITANTNPPETVLTIKGFVRPKE